MSEYAFDVTIEQGGFEVDLEVETGLPGLPGQDGKAGPNLIDGDTECSLTGLLVGVDGGIVAIGANTYIASATLGQPNGPAKLDADGNLSNGLGVFRPTITVQPSNTSVSDGSTASLSIAATTPAPRAVLVYQWQVWNGMTWGNVAGATNAAYTTPPLAVEQSGIKYRCVVSNQFGSETSGESTVTVTLSMPSGAVGIWYAKDYNATWKGIPNAVSGSPLLPLWTRHARGAFASGVVGGEGGTGGWLNQAGLTITEKYAAGRDGVVAATRAVFSAANSASVRYRQTFSLPAGTYTMAIDAKSNGADQDFTMSANGGTTTATKTATSALQQFKHEFTLAVTTTFDGRFMATVAGAAGDFTIDKAFLWGGNAASVPADLTLQGDMLFGNSAAATGLSVTGGVASFANGEVGSIDFNAMTTYSEVTILAVVKRTATFTSGFRHPFLWDVLEGTTSGLGGNSIALGDMDTEGGITASFGGKIIQSAVGGFNPNLFADGGWHVLSMAGGVSLDYWIDDVGMAVNVTSTTATRSSRKFQVGNNNAVIGLRPYQINAIALYSRKLTDVERRLAVKSLIANAAGSGIAITKPANLLIAGFDSITAGPASNSYAQQYLSHVAAGKVVRAQNEAIGGSTLALNPQPQLNLSTRLPFHLAAIPANAADRVGRKFIVTLLPGANDLQPNYASTQAFLDALWLQVDQLRARGATVGIATILAKGTAISGSATHNARRADANTSIRASVGTHCDFVIDFAADATIGTDAAANNVALFGDGIHPTATAHTTYLEPIYRAAVNSWLI